MYVTHIIRFRFVLIVFCANEHNHHMEYYIDRSMKQMCLKLLPVNVKSIVLFRYVYVELNRIYIVLFGEPSDLMRSRCLYT